MFIDAAQIALVILGQILGDIGQIDTLGRGHGSLHDGLRLRVVQVEGLVRGRGCREDGRERGDGFGVVRQGGLVGVEGGRLSGVQAGDPVRVGGDGAGFGEGEGREKGAEGEEEG